MSFLGNQIKVVAWKLNKLRGLPPYASDELLDKLTAFLEAVAGVADRDLAGRLGVYADQQCDLACERGAELCRACIASKAINEAAAVYLDALTAIEKIEAAMTPNKETADEG